jgi:hypothetical protein
MFFNFNSKVVSLKNPSFTKSAALVENHDTPLRVNFERQLKRIQQDVLRMGALVEQSCNLARQAMFDRDLEAAAQIKVQDREIDALYRQIEVGCVNLIALQSPGCPRFTDAECHDAARPGPRTHWRLRQEPG